MATLNHQAVHIPPFRRRTSTQVKQPAVQYPSSKVDPHKKRLEKPAVRKKRTSYHVISIGGSSRPICGLKIG